MVYLHELFKSLCAGTERQVPQVEVCVRLPERIALLSDPDGLHHACKLELLQDL